MCLRASQSDPPLLHHHHVQHPLSLQEVTGGQRKTGVHGHHTPFLCTARFACQAGVQPLSLVRSLILSLPNISAISTFYPVTPSFKLSQHLVPPSHPCLSHSHTLSSHPLCVSLSFPSHACRYTHPADLRTHTEIPPTPHFLHDTPGPSPARVHGWNPVSCEYFFEYILEYYILDLTQMSPPACPSPCAQIPQA